LTGSYPWKGTAPPPGTPAPDPRDGPGGSDLVPSSLSLFRKPLPRSVQNDSRRLQFCSKPCSRLPGPVGNPPQNRLAPFRCKPSLDPPNPIPILSSTTSRLFTARAPRPMRAPVG
jgi:hypothetical protein